MPRLSSRRYRFDGIEWLCSGCVPPPLAFVTYFEIHPSPSVDLHRGSVFAVQANTRRTCYDFPVAFCEVQYKDTEGIKHECTVQADSLFEAVAAAVREFRERQWCGAPPGPGCEFSVQVLPEVPPQTHTVSLTQVQDFARFGAVKGPKGIVRKNRIRELLGIPDPP